MIIEYRAEAVKNGFADYEISDDKETPGWLSMSKFYKQP